MPLYFFDVKDGHRLTDPSGLECRDDQDAEQKAIVIAQQIARDSPPSAVRYVAILNGDRREIGKVKIDCNPTGDKQWQ